VGNVEDEQILELLNTTAGFRKLVYSIGVSVESDTPKETVDFCLQMYGRLEGEGGTFHKVGIPADGMEYVIKLSDVVWGLQD